MGASSLRGSTRFRALFARATADGATSSRPHAPRLMSARREARYASAKLVLTAGALWGRESLRKGEAFTALFDLLGHAAPLGRSGDGKPRLRPPLAGLSSLEPSRGLDAVVIVVLGSTTFDGVTRTTWWSDIANRTSGAANTLLGTVGLLWAIGLVAVVYAGAMRATARLTQAHDTPAQLSLAFAHSLVPIAFAYSVAHYFSLLVLEGQGIISLISDPFGFGWDLFGTADRDV